MPAPRLPEPSGPTPRLPEPSRTEPRLPGPTRPWAPHLLRGPAIVAAVGLLIASLAVAVRLGWAPLEGWDQWAVAAAGDVTRAHPALRDALIVWDEVFRPWHLHLAAVPVVVAVGAAGLRNRALWGWFTMVTGWAIGYLVKRLVQRPRPMLSEPLAQAEGYSFPSGHTVNACLVSTVVLIMVWPLLPTRPAWRRALVLLAGGVVTLTALDRVYLGVHHPSDVVAGILLGLGLSYASWVACRPALACGPALGRRRRAGPSSGPAR